MKFICHCLQGIAIGAGAILPGISSGVFCVIFGIYETLLDSILHFFKDIKKNLKFLLPIILGSTLGIVLFGNLLNYFIYQFPIQTKSIFIGLILGSLPTLLKQIKEKEKSEKTSNFSPIIFFFISFLFGITCIFLENSLHFSTLENISFPYLILCGFLMSVRNCYSWY